MITKFQYFIFEDLTYDETLYKYEFSEAIKDYFIKKYPSDCTEIANGRKILGRYGYAITNNTAKNILKFAKKHKDNALIGLVLTHMNRLNDPEFFKNYKLDRDTKKYNL